MITEGEYAGGDDAFVVPPDTPSSVRGYWSSTRATRAVVVTEEYCRAKASEMGTQEWIICLVSQCDLQTHNDARAKKMEFKGPTLVIEVPTASAATKRRGFNRPYISLEDFPESFLEVGGIDHVLDLRLPPMDLRALFMTYPGKDLMRALLLDGVDAVALYKNPQMRKANPDQVPSAVRAEDRGLSDEDSNLSFPNWENLGSDAFRSRHGGPGSAATFPTYPTQAATTPHRLMRQLSEVHERVDKLEKRFDVKDLALAGTFRKVRMYVDQEIARVLAASQEYASNVLGSAGPAGSFGNSNSRSYSGGLVTGAPLGMQQGGGELETAIREQVTETLRCEFEDKLQAKLQEVESKYKQEIDSFKRYCDSVDLATRLQRIENEFHDPTGAVKLLEKAVEALEDQRSEKAVVRAKQVFKSESDVEAWASALGHSKDMHKFVPDMVTIIMLTSQPFATFEGAMAVYGSTAKAQFADLLEAQVKVSHDVIYPENVITLSTSKEAASVGGLRWAPQFMTAGVFEGDLRNGTIVRMKDDIHRVRDGFKATYAVTFPPDRFPIVHAILMEQLTEATSQALGWLEEMQLPFYRALRAGGWRRRRLGHGCLWSTSNSSKIFDLSGQ